MEDTKSIKTPYLVDNKICFAIPPTQHTAADIRNEILTKCKHYNIFYTARPLLSAMLGSRL